MWKCKVSESVWCFSIDVLKFSGILGLECPGVFGLVFPGVWFIGFLFFGYDVLQFSGVFGLVFPIYDISRCITFSYIMVYEIFVFHWGFLKTFP